jgi:malate dehydrogenase (oxaloacetate-decarboxylating)(NADP+)
MSNDQLFKTPKDHVRGISLLPDPKKTRDTALTAEQRREYGLEGLLPHVAESSPGEL